MGKRKEEGVKGGGDREGEEVKGRPPGPNPMSEVR